MRSPITGCAITHHIADALRLAVVHSDKHIYRSTSSIASMLSSILCMYLCYSPWRCCCTACSLRHGQLCRYCLNPVLTPSPEHSSEGRVEVVVRSPSKEETDQFGMRYNQHLNRWTYPFQFSPVNSRVVRRSAALLGYSPNFKCESTFVHVYTFALAARVQLTSLQTVTCALILFFSAQVC